MQEDSSTYAVQKALKLLDGVEDHDKTEGLILLDRILKTKDRQLVELGYHEVIFKELIKLVQFDTSCSLNTTIDLLKDHFYGQKEHLDELAETLIYRVARSTDYEVSKLCLNAISNLIDQFDESIAKHSKQILKLVDLNDMTDLNPLYRELLLKLKPKLPSRKR